MSDVTATTHGQRPPHESTMWVAVFGAVLIWLALNLSWEINRPWINGADFNGAVWSQAAHNILRAGLTETSGASSGFYFGPLPIPQWGYYLHHPPLLHLMIAALFAVFGEHEWVARLVPVSCSLTSATFLWLLVRDCVGVRTATLSAAVFASLPMQLRYGAMVNFEPCVLMLMLGALLCLRRHQRSSDSRWKWGALGFVLIGLWVDWAMYLFVIALSGCWLLRSSDRDRRFAWIICLSALLSGVAYLLRIQMLRPDAWQNLSHTFLVRLGAGDGDHFTEVQWLTRLANTLATHFLPVGLILGAIGAAILWRSRTQSEGSHWLGRASFSLFVMDALFVGLFQNDSYIHQYIAFYWLAPIAIAAGVTLDRTIAALQTAPPARLFPSAVEITACLVLVALGASGFYSTQSLVRRFRILDYRTEEPPGLIPELGKAIRTNFPAGTHVLCNFVPDYGPHLAYYAQRNIINNLSEDRFWRPFLEDPSARVGGVVWISSNILSQNIVAKLPPGTKRFFTIGNLNFCFWQRASVKK